MRQQAIAISDSIRPQCETRRIYNVTPGFITPWLDKPKKTHVRVRLRPINLPDERAPVLSTNWRIHRVPPMYSRVAEQITRLWNFDIAMENHHSATPHLIGHLFKSHMIDWLYSYEISPSHWSIINQWFGLRESLQDFPSVFSHEIGGVTSLSFFQPIHWTNHQKLRGIAASPKGLCRRRFLGLLIEGLLVMGGPPRGWFIREDPMKKWMMTGVPLF